IRRLLCLGATVTLMALTALAWLIVPENRARLREAFTRQHAQAQADPTPPTTPVSKDNGNSEAERIARLHRLIDADEKQLDDAKKRLTAPDSEYKRAEAAFRAADDALAPRMKEVQKLRQSGKKAEADSLEKELEPLKKKRQEARERFDLAIQ